MFAGGDNFPYPKINAFHSNGNPKTGTRIKIPRGKCLRKSGNDGNPSLRYLLLYLLNLLLYLLHHIAVRTVVPGTCCWWGIIRTAVRTCWKKYLGKRKNIHGGNYNVPSADKLVNARTRYLLLLLKYYPYCCTYVLRKIHGDTKKYPPEGW